MWKFSRTERLEDLIARCREQDVYLLRERCDHRDPASQAALDVRLAIVQHRLRRLCLEARAARRSHRNMATTV